MATGADPSRRLELAWLGGHGDAYVERNLGVGSGRARFWQQLLERLKPRSALEVGCSSGPNLTHLIGLVPTVVGLDINRSALGLCKGSRVQGTATELPFSDGSFDLVFATGVLMHIEPRLLSLAVRELARCSRRYVVSADYGPWYSKTTHAGLANAVFGTRFDVIFRSNCPELRLMRSYPIGEREGFARMD